ncbi:MAG TPA: methyltransferase type 11 [Bacteroidales bacterium]|nr:methyltransferase type 11 [Bacteroidales bacterium]
MQYEPVKRSVGRFFSGPLFMRIFLYRLLDLLLLRTWHIKKALRNLISELPDNSEILDSGSGFGQYTWRMSGMNKTWKLTGVDIDTDQVEDCTRFFKRAGISGRVNFLVADLTTYTDPGKFNLIISVDVMEHISDDVTVFRNFFSSLKENGILIISTPSDKGGSGAQSHKDESFIGEHVRNGYSIADIKDKLCSAGFINIDVKYTYGTPGNISWLISMKYPVMLLNISLIFALFLPFYYLIVFPVALILNILDLRLSHKKGSGLIVTARK